MPTSEFASVFILVFTFSMFVVILINRHLFHAFVFERYWSVWQKQKANLLVYHLIWGFSSHSLHLKHKSAILDIKYLLTIVTIIITIDLWICICTLTLFYFSSSVFTVIRELYHILPSEDFRFELRFKFQISLLQCHNTLQFHIASNLNRFNWEETATIIRGENVESLSFTWFLKSCLIANWYFCIIPLQQPEFYEIPEEYILHMSSSCYHSSSRRVFRQLHGNMFCTVFHSIAHDRIHRAALKVCFKSDLASEL